VFVRDTHRSSGTSAVAVSAACKEVIIKGKQPLGTRRIRGGTALMAAAAGLILSASISHAASTLFWDPANSGSAAGGNGTWDTSISGWFNGTGDILWPDVTGFYTASFGGTAGTVTLAGTETANALAFTTAGYTLTGGTLNLASATATTSSPVINASTSATISSAISGSGFTKTGNGVLTLNGATNVTGQIYLSQGSMTLNGAAATISAAGFTIVGSSGQLISSLATAGDNALAAPALFLTDGAASVDHFGTTPVTLKGGSIYYQGSSTPGGTIQNLTVSTGGLVAVQAVGTGTKLNLGTLTLGNTATVTFESFSQSIGTGTANEGEIYIGNLSLNGGAATPPVSNTAVMLGANLTVQSAGAGTDGKTHFAAYGPNGVTAITGVVTSLLGSTNPTDNVEDTGTTIAAPQTVNSLASNGGDTHINNNSLLTITSGGVIMGGNNHWIKADTGNSSMTAGLGGNYQFIATVNGNGTDYQFNHVGIVDNGSNSVTFIKAGIGQLALTNVASSYTGVTYINNGTLRLNTANGGAGQLSGSPSIVINPGGTLQLNAGDVIGFTAGKEVLTINGGTVSNITAAARVTLQNAVTMTGGTLTGTGTGDANGAFSLDQAGGTTINATSDASGTPATISAATLGLQSGNVTFNVTPGVAHPASDLNVTGKIIPYNGSAFGLLKTGNGIMTLSGANTYTGASTISAGTVVVAANVPSGAAGALGNATSAIVLGDASTNVNNSSPSLLTGGAVTVARPVTVAAQSTTGAYTIGGSSANVSTFSGAVTLNEPLTLSQANGGVLNITGGITDNTAGAHTMKLQGPGAINISSLGITEASGPIAVDVVSGTTTFAAPNNYTGGTTLDGGKIVLSGAGTLGVTNSSLIINSGSLDIGGTNPTLAYFAGTGGSVFNNGSANGILTIGGGDASGGNFAGAIADGTHKVNVTKTGAGTMTLSGANTYTGNTLVAAGTLALGNGASSNNLANSPLISISSGATLDVSGLNGGGMTVGNGQTLGGGGSVIGNLTGGSGSVLNPGGTFANQILSLSGSLTLSAGSNLTYVLGTPGASLSSLGNGALFTVQNTLTLPSAPGSLTLTLIDNANANGLGSLGNGYYELFTYGTLVGNPTTAFAPATGKTYSFFTQTVGSVHELILQVSVQRLTWTGKTNGTGANDSAWNTTSTNWASNSTAAAYSDGSIVTFNDTNAVTSGSITPALQNIQIQSAGVAPQSVTFNNNAVTYTLNNAGANGVTGALTTLFANGPGTVALNGANSYGGGTTISGGKLVAGNPAALGGTGGTVTLTGGSLDLATDASVNAYNVAVSGLATISPDKATVNSAGITHALGSLTIGSNQLNVAGGANVNSGTAGLSFSSATVNGNGILDITNPTGGGSTLVTLGPVVNNGTLTFTGNGNVAQSAPWSGGGITFDSNFTGTAVLNQANTYSGGTMILNGTVQAGNNSAFGAVNSAITLGLGAVLDLNGFNLSSYPITINGSGPAGNGAIINAGAAQNQALSKLTLGSDATIGGGPGTGPGGANRWDIRGAVSVTGNGYNLTKVGNNYIAIAATTGGVTGVQNININGGTLAVVNNTSVDNSFPGSIFVNPGGILSVGNYGSTPGIVESKPIVMAGGLLQTDTTTANGNATIAAAISLNSAASISAQTGSNLTLNGIISDGTNGPTAATFGALANPGTVTLKASNTYSGGTTVAYGTLALGFGGATGTLAPGSSVTVNAGATLQMTAADAYGFFGGSPAPANVSGTMTAVGGLHVTLPGIVLNGGTLTSSGAGNSGPNNSNYIFDGDVTTVPGATTSMITASAISLRGQNAPNVGDHSITFNVPRGTASTDLKITSPIQDSGFGLTKTGNGILALTATNTYTGPTLLNQGTILATNNSSLGTGAVTLGGGKLQLAGQQGIININFVGTGGSVTGNSGVVDSGNWNNITGNASTTAIPLNDSNGAAGAATLTSFTATNTFSTGSTNQLLNGYLDNTGAGQNVVIAGIPYTGYSVYAYFGSDGVGRTGSMTIGTTTYDYSTQGNVTAYTQTTDTTGANPSANYAIFSNQTTSGFTITQNRGSNNSGLMGLQIVSNGAGVNLANAVTVSADSAIDVTGSNTGAISGVFTIGSNQLSVTGGSTGANTAYSLTLGGAGGVVFTGNPTFNVANNGTGVGTVSLGGISDSGGGSSLTKTGNGTLVISGAAGYSGPTNINGGTLAVGISGTLVSSQINIAHGANFDVSAPGIAYTITPGAAVAATGTGSQTSTITGSIDAQLASVISTGSTGVLAITGNALIESGAVLSISLAKSGAHSGVQPDLTDYSELSIAGNGSIDGSTLNLSLGTGIQTGDIFTIILSSAQVSGTFAGIPNLSTFTMGGQQFKINYAYSPAGNFTDTTGPDVALMAVPEPGTIASLCGGIGMLAGLQRFRRRR